MLCFPWTPARVVDEYLLLSEKIKVLAEKRTAERTDEAGKRREARTGLRNTVCKKGYTIIS